MNVLIKCHHFSNSLQQCNSCCHNPSLQANSDSLVYSIEAGKPISLEKRDNYILPSPQSALGPSRPSPNLMRYLNATSSKGPLDDLRKQMLVSRGKLLVEMVESLSGKPVPGKVRKLRVSLSQDLVNAG